MWAGEICAVGEGERFIVRGPDLYQAACELAQAVGVDLADALLFYAYRVDLAASLNDLAECWSIPISTPRR